MNKSVFLFLITCMLFWKAADAQPIVGYGVESKTGTYQELTGGTIVGNGLSGGALRMVAFTGQAVPVKELTTSPGLPVGFDFSFNNSRMNKFAIGSDGYIVLGEKQVTVDPRSAMSILGAMGEGRVNVIGLATNRGVAGLESTRISYQTLGTAPDRILVVQYKNLGIVYGSWYEETTDLAPVDLQIRLYETTNQIELVFRNWVNPSSRMVTVRTGIKGSLENDRLLLESKTNNWEEIQLTSREAAMMNWSAESAPADGLTYRFTPPQECTAPVTVLSGLQLTPSSTEINGAFTASPAADYYLVAMSETENLSAQPANGSYYKTGDRLGNGTVIAFDSLTRFATPETLPGNKPYYFHIYAANTFCLSGPKYNTDHPLKGQTATLPGKPSLALLESGYDRITLSPGKNQAADEVLVAMTEIPAKSNQGTVLIDGEFGQPAGTLNVGDFIEGGGKVIYKGDASGLLEVPGLTDYTLYHFKAWSFDGQGNYSTEGATVNQTTWGKVPFIPDFSKMPDFNVPPQGWDSETFRLIYDRNKEIYQIMCDLTSVDPLNGVLSSITTPWILLKEGVNKMEFSLSLVAGRLPYNEWDERDYLEIQVSEDGETFTTFHTIDKENMLPMASTADFITYVPNIKDEGGKKVKIRFNWKCHKVVRLLMEAFSIVEKPLCDRPVNVKVDAASVVGSRATLQWTAVGDESVWEIRSRKAGDEAWAEPLEVRTNPYQFTGLPINSELEMQVRARCSLTSSSQWSQTAAFATGYAIPFTETFDRTTLPAGWRFENGLLSDPTEFCTEAGMSCPKNWRFLQKSLRILYSAKPKDWVITPPVDLGDGSYHGRLEFDLKYKKSNSNPTPDDIRFAVVLAKEGEAFSPEQVILELGKADFATLADSTRFAIDLSPYSGVVRLGFYAYTQTAKSGEELMIDRLMLLETCPAVAALNVNDITTHSASVSWEGTSGEWLTFIREPGSTEKAYQVQTENRWSLTDLAPRTRYEVGVTRSCTLGDTARVVVAGFTTQSMAPCPVPAAVSAVASQTHVTLSFEGEAMSYRVKFRPSGSQEWATRTTDTPSLKIDGLEPDSDYEYTVQAVCSQADGDESDWTEVAAVSTLPVTCWVPESVQVVPTHESAAVTWEGEADDYQLLFREEGKEETLLTVKSAKTYRLDGLSSLTNYSVRLRSICAVGDTSQWSVAAGFKTLDIPACVAPFDLEATGISEGSATLAWDADPGNLTWDLRYREGSATNWNTVSELAEKQYTVDGLKVNTAYLWSVKASCDDEQTSDWAVQNRFTTQPSGISETEAAGLKVFVSDGIINVVNPSGVRVDRIRMFAADGVILKEFSIHSEENVMIPAAVPAGVVILKVYGHSFVQTYTLIIGS